MTKFFYIGFWQYVFENNTGIKNIICRIKGHDDVWWFSSGEEPDMHCQNCQEDLG